MKRFEQVEHSQYYRCDITDKKARRREHGYVRKHRYNGYLKVAQRRLARHIANRDPENALPRAGNRGTEF